jgi:hypothetical protein
MGDRNGGALRLAAPPACIVGHLSKLCCEVQVCRRTRMGEASESLEASGEVVGVDEVAQMSPQLVVRLVEVA